MPSILPQNLPPVKGYICFLAALSREDEGLREAGVEAAMRAAYNREPQWTGEGERRRAKTYEECYGCSPLEKLDDRAEMEASIRAYLAASPVASREDERDICGARSPETGTICTEPPEHDGRAHHGPDLNHPAQEGRHAIWASWA